MSKQHDLDLRDYQTKQDEAADAVVRALCERFRQITSKEANDYFRDQLFYLVRYHT